MPKELERDLGLYATVTVSFGAMVGIGVFVLPGLAYELGGPGMILAYVLAGLVVLPAALSKAEMATAMPEAGGTYLYIDRSMGPLLGTIAGLGAWFSLAFKSAFALVGLGAYLVLFLSVPTKAVALALTVLVVGVNVVGVKQSGRFQNVVVTAVVVGLLAFVAAGVTAVESANYRPFFGRGKESLLSTTGVLFVAYAGVTKIASVAEEVENPSRNIPLGLLLSLGLMAVGYLLITVVLVGALAADELAGNATAVADVAGRLFGPAGRTAMAVVGVLALISLANAGVLGSSRFPFAMSRDQLAPARLADVHPRFRTPAVAILLTGAVMVALIAFVPILELAKLASAFKILVFSLVNVALVAFRESGLESYDPDFVAPGYPWVQLFGLASGLVLLTRMGTLPTAGAIGIILAGVVWYRVYGRERTEREGAALDAIRRGADRRALAATEATFSGETGNVMVALDRDISAERESTLLFLAAAIAARKDGRVYATMFESVPEQTGLEAAASERTPADDRFERQTRAVAETLPVAVEVEEVVSHDVGRAVVNHAEEAGAEVLLGEWEPERFRAELLGTDVDWYMRHASCDAAFVWNRGVGTVGEVAVLTTRGPHAPRKVVLADAIAVETGATLRFITAVDEGASADRIATAEALHDELGDLCAAPAESEVVRARDSVAGLVRAAGDADLAIVGAYAHSPLYDALVGDVSTAIAARLRCTVLLVHPRATHGESVRRLLERVVY